MNTEVTMEKLIALAKNRGFIYPGSEIYGGLANAWDYGPLGVEFKNNIKDAWRRKFVQESKYNVGMDAAILMNPQTWVASGHIGGFVDPLIDCRHCKARFRVDKLIKEYLKKKEDIEELTVDGWSNKEVESFIQEKKIKCPGCGKTDFTGVRQFNLMFKTFQGVMEDSQEEIYLRPETAQGIFINFKNVQRTSRKRIPFGIAQVGKSFRNEITPGNFIFRTREFEQMELEFFCKPGTELEWFAYWKNYTVNFLKSLGFSEKNLKLRDHDSEELSHYSNATTDIEYRFPFGWGELWGITSRTDYDLKAHQMASGQDMSYIDPETNEKYVPYCIEPSVGVERMLLAFLLDAYDEEILIDSREKENVRTVLHLHPVLAPYKAAVLPLTKKLALVAEPIYEELAKYFSVDYDLTGSIGRRYRREDEIGTPFSICVDFDTETDNCVTIRDRDTMEQIRIPVGQLKRYIEQKLVF